MPVLEHFPDPRKMAQVELLPLPTCCPRHPHCWASLAPASQPGSVVALAVRLGYPARPQSRPPFSRLTPTPKPTCDHLQTQCPRPSEHPKSTAQPAAPSPTALPGTRQGFAARGSSTCLVLPALSHSRVSGMPRRPLATTSPCGVPRAGLQRALCRRTIQAGLQMQGGRLREKQPPFSQSHPLPQQSRFGFVSPDVKQALDTSKQTSPCCPRISASQVPGRPGHTFLLPDSPASTPRTPGTFSHTQPPKRRPCCPTTHPAIPCVHTHSPTLPPAP